MCHIAQGLMHVIWMGGVYTLKLIKPSKYYVEIHLSEEEF